MILSRIRKFIKLDFDNNSERAHWLVVTEDNDNTSMVDLSCSFLISRRETIHSKSSEGDYVMLYYFKLTEAARSSTFRKSFKHGVLLITPIINITEAENYFKSNDSFVVGGNWSRPEEFKIKFINFKNTPLPTDKEIFNNLKKEISESSKNFYELLDQNFEFIQNNYQLVKDFYDYNRMVIKLPRHNLPIPSSKKNSVARNQEDKLE